MAAARYEIIRQLACGGMAEVLLARRTPDDGSPPELIVIKRVLPHLTQADGFMRMFATESRIASQLRHPNIVAVIEVGEMDQLPFIAMERLDGADLLRLLQQCVLRRQPLGPAVAMAVVAGAARGLGYAHRARARDGRPLKIIHRDVSPHNIFVTRDGGVKLLDFGIAKSAAQATNTHTGQVKGKISYMSPEQIRAKPLDARSDLWSLGVVLWESVAGEKLFTRDNDAATLHAILHDPIPPLLRPEAPGLDELVDSILQRDPQRRIGTAEEIAQRLEALLQRTGHAQTAKLVAQRVSSLVPALSPEIDAARPAVMRNPEVVTFAVGPAMARSAPVAEPSRGPGADRPGAARRLAVSDPPAAAAHDDGDPTLLEIAAPPPDADFDQDDTIERHDRPRVGENTDTHTIPLRRAIQATGTGGDPAVARAAAAAVVSATARGVSVPSPRRPSLPASIEVVPELTAEFDSEGDVGITAPTRRAPTLAPPGNRAPARPLRSSGSPAPLARAGGPAPLQNPLANKPLRPAPGTKSPPAGVPARTPSPAAPAAPPRPTGASPSPPSPPSPAPSPNLSASPAPALTPSRAAEAPAPPRPAAAPTPGPAPRALEATPPAPKPRAASELPDLFGPPAPPSSPFGEIPPLRAPPPSTSPVGTSAPISLDTPIVSGPRRTQRIETLKPPRRRHGAIALAVGGLCAVAGLVVLGAYFSGGLGGPASALPVAAPPPAVAVPPVAAPPVAVPPVAAPPVAAAPVAAPPVAARPAAPPVAAPSVVAPPVAARPAAPPVAAPPVAARPAAPPDIASAPPSSPVARPLVQVVTAEPRSPTARRPVATPPVASAAPRPAPPAVTAARPRPTAPRAGAPDPFDTVQPVGSRANPPRPVAARPVPAVVRAANPAPTPSAPPPRRGPPPSVRGGTIYQDL